MRNLKACDQEAKVMDIHGHFCDGNFLPISADYEINVH